MAGEELWVQCVCMHVCVCLSNSGPWCRYTLTGDGQAKRGHFGGPHVVNHIKMGVNGILRRCSGVEIVSVCFSCVLFFRVCVCVCLPI